MQNVSKKLKLIRVNSFSFFCYLGRWKMKIAPTVPIRIKTKLHSLRCLWTRLMRLFSIRLPANWHELRRSHIILSLQICPNHIVFFIVSPIRHGLFLPHFLNNSLKPRGGIEFGKANIIVFIGNFFTIFWNLAEI